MASNKEKHAVTGLEYGFLIFGTGLTPFSIIYTVTGWIIFFVCRKTEGSEVNRYSRYFYYTNWVCYGLFFFPENLFVKEKK
jgi:hypothetical protein